VLKHLYLERYRSIIIVLLYSFVLVTYHVFTYLRYQGVEEDEGRGFYSMVFHTFLGLSVVASFLLLNSYD
jgi:hypothetical protein